MTKDDELARRLKEIGLQLQVQLAPLNATLERARAIGAGMPDYSNLLRNALGPYEEMRRTLEMHSANLEQYETVIRTFRNLQVQYVDLSSVAHILEGFELSPAHRAFAELTEKLGQSSKLAAAMNAMKEPWIDRLHAMESLEGFARLQSMGLALRSLSPFSEEVSENLRSNLGDWRDAIDFSSIALDDALARTKFYGEHGFNSTITAFPPDAFVESTEIAGLRPCPAKGLSEPADAFSEDGVDQERQAAAFRQLARLEREVRDFLYNKLTHHFGEQWIKQVPTDIFARWEERRNKALKAGEKPMSIVHYADFGDYLQIIEFSQNWKDVFSTVFQRRTLVQESFQRLYPIRNCTMHARFITQDDEIYLLAEALRLRRAMGL